MTIDDKMKNITNIPETPGRLVMKYGILGHCKKLDSEFQEKILTKFYSGANFTRKELEKIFPNAISRIKKWSIEGVRDYFIKEHNKYAKQESCKVNIYEVFEYEKRTDVVVVHQHGKELKFINEYGLHLKKGYKISTHLGKIIEILPKNYN